MANPARTLHRFFLASTLIVSIGALVATRTLGGFVAGVEPLDFVALLLGGAVVALAWRLRSRLTTVLLWSLLELPALLGAVALFVTHRVLAFALLALLAVLGLVVASPGRLGAEIDRVT